MSGYTGTQPTDDDDQPGEANPYAPPPAEATPSPAELGVEHLTVQECWRLLEASRVGRIAIATADGRPDLLPVNFLAHAGSIFLRSAPGAKMQHLAEAPAVSFEVDGSDPHFHWSVVISADARRLDTDEEIEESGVLDLLSYSPTAKHDFVMLSPVAVSGRRFPRRPQARDADARRPVEHRQYATEPASARDGAPRPTRPHDTKPQPIPHFAPRGE